MSGEHAAHSIREIGDVHKELKTKVSELPLELASFERSVQVRNKSSGFAHY